LCSVLKGRNLSKQIPADKKSAVWDLLSPYHSWALKRSSILSISRCYIAHQLKMYALSIISNLGIILELTKIVVSEETEHHNVNHFWIGII
jgi:hypothetical protein